MSSFLGLSLMTLLWASAPDHAYTGWLGKRVGMEKSRIMFINISRMDACARDSAVGDKVLLKIRNIGSLGDWDVDWPTEGGPACWSYTMQDISSVIQCKVKATPKTHRHPNGQEIWNGLYSWTAPGARKTHRLFQKAHQTYCCDGWHQLSTWQDPDLHGRQTYEHACVELSRWGWLRWEDPPIPWPEILNYIHGEKGTELASVSLLLSTDATLGVLSVSSMMDGL